MRSSGRSIGPRARVLLPLIAPLRTLPARAASGRPPPGCRAPGQWRSIAGVTSADPAALLADAKPYRPIAVVTARRLTEPLTWLSERGDRAAGGGRGLAAHRRRRQPVDHRAGDLRPQLPAGDRTGRYGEARGRRGGPARPRPALDPAPGGPVGGRTPGTAAGCGTRPERSGPIIDRLCPGRATGPSDATTVDRRAM